MAQAMEWASRITTVALEMVLPGLAGLWLDARWDLRFLGPSGFALGMAVGIWHLLRMTAAADERRGKDDRAAHFTPRSSSSHDRHDSKDHCHEEKDRTNDRIDPEP
jgi:hypothetical protein